MSFFSLFRLGLLTLVPLLLAFGGSRDAALGKDPPPMPREFRGAWIATVANIDWPTRPGLPVESQQQELLALLDKAVELNLNAIVLQVRPACDAFYESRFEPWSPWLTGQMGQPPSPSYDPLAFAVEEAHRRGLQLHAWFNPYRAAHPTHRGPLSENHVSNTLEGAAVAYGKYLWLDPGAAKSEEHSLRVVTDVVRRYDVDGVHFDDYFYPYPVSEPIDNGDDDSTREKPFPDDRSWEEYTARTPAASRLSRADWRRENVNRFIRRVGESVHREKPWVAFGVSPFGIWRPGHPSGIKGFDAYEKLYADSKRWLEEGWVDYLAPQLYWPIASPGQSYPALMEWWAGQNPAGRRLFVGNYTSRIGDKPNGKSVWAASEVVEQVRLTQAFAGASGNIHFSMKALAANRDGIADALKAGPYAAPALAPAFDAPADAARLAKPRVTLEGSLLHLQPQGGDNPALWVVQTFADGEWRGSVLPGTKNDVNLPAVSGSLERIERIAVRAVDRYGRESEAAVMALPIADRP